MTEKNPKVVVQVKYNGIEQTFEGTAEETWTLTNKFLSQQIPAFKIAQKLWLSVDSQVLAKDCEGLVAFSPEGINLLIAKSRLTDNETLALWLLAAYLAKQLNLSSSDALSKENLQAKLGKSNKITSTRLGELVKNEMITKTADDNFKITTFGILQMQKEIIPRIKNKTNS